MSFVVGTVLGIVKNDEILLINRNKYPFVGFWDLPGGKVKMGERIEETALREALEETGLDMNFHSFRGTVSARIMESGKALNHFILLVCRLSPKEGEIKQGGEGELRWFKLSELDGMKDRIIPDDLHMINKMILSGEKKNFTSVMEKNGDDYILREFEVNEYGKK